MLNNIDPAVLHLLQKPQKVIHRQAGQKQRHWQLQGLYLRKVGNSNRTMGTCWPAVRPGMSHRVTMQLQASRDQSNYCWWRFLARLLRGFELEAEMPSGKTSIGQTHIVWRLGQEVLDILWCSRPGGHGCGMWWPDDRRSTCGSGWPVYSSWLRQWLAIADHILESSWERPCSYRMPL